jgi:amino acid transporter
MTVVGIIYTYFSIFQFSLLSSLFNYGTAGQFFVFLVVAIAAVVYPYRRKDIFDASDPTAKRKIGGIPLITILGAISVLVCIITIYAIIKPLIGGATFVETLFAGVVATFALGAIIYAISYFVRKSQGIDLSLLQREIPPE